MQPANWRKPTDHQPAQPHRTTGKRTKALYAAKFGVEPARKDLALVAHHRLMQVFAYGREDTELLRQAVAGYAKTSFLLTTGA